MTQRLRMTTQQKVTIPCPKYRTETVFRQKSLTEEEEGPCKTMNTVVHINEIMREREVPSVGRSHSSYKKAMWILVATYFTLNYHIQLLGKNKKYLHRGNDKYIDWSNAQKEKYWIIENKRLMTCHHSSGRPTMGPGNKDWK
jgi:hypothetical protein